MKFVTVELCVDRKFYHALKYYIGKLFKIFCELELVQKKITESEVKFERKM